MLNKIQAPLYIIQWPRFTVLFDSYKIENRLSQGREVYLGGSFNCYFSLFIIKNTVEWYLFTKGLSRKDILSKGVCPFRTFCGQRGVVFKSGRPNILVQKTWDFSKMNVNVIFSILCGCLLRTVPIVLHRHRRQGVEGRSGLISIIGRFHYQQFRFTINIKI